MKLNPACVRDILLYLEENLAYKNIRGYREHETITMEKVAEILSQTKEYSDDEAYYAIEKLIEAKYLTCTHCVYGNDKSLISCDIADITYNGHAFLNTVRPETIWEKTCNISKKLGNCTLEFILSTANDIAVALGKQLISQMLGISND